MDSADTSADNKTSLLDLGLEALHSGAYAIQERAQGLTQTVNHLTGLSVPDVNLLSAPKETEFGSLRWHAQQVGAGIGGALPYFGAFAGAQKLSMLAGTRLLSETGAVSLARSLDTIPGSFAVGATTGFIYDGLTSPVDPNSQDFWGDRRNQAGVGALTYGVASASWLKSAGRWASVRSPELGAVLRNPFVGSTTGGIMAGAVNAEATSYVRDGHAADTTDVLKGAYTFGFTGLSLGALTHFTSPRNMSNPQETINASRDAVPSQSVSEGRAIQREVNRYGDDPVTVMENVLKKPDVRVLAIGESHTDANGTRKALSELVPRVKAAGHDVILAEEAPSWMQPHFDHYIKTGQFDLASAADESQRTSLSKLNPLQKITLDVARNNGVEMKAIDSRVSESGERLTLDQRNVVQAQAIQKLIADNPESKIIWSGGLSHMADNSGENSAVFQLRANLRENGQSPDMVATMLGQYNNGRPFNLLPVTKSLNRPAALPIRDAGPFSAMPLWDTIHSGLKVGEYDYLAMYPRRTIGDGGRLADDFFDTANDFEKKGHLPEARHVLYDAWHAAEHEDEPVGKVLIATSLARIDGALGYTEQSAKWLDLALHYNKFDPMPEKEDLLRLIADPRFVKSKRVEPTTQPPAEEASGEINAEPQPPSPAVSVYENISDEDLTQMIKRPDLPREVVPLLPRAYWIAPSDLGRRWPPGT